MKVWIDLLSGDEMVSDSYPHTVEFDNTILVVKSRLVTKGQEDFGIGNSKINNLFKAICLPNLIK